MPETLSCDLLILVNQPAEPVSSSDLVEGGEEDVGGGLTESAVRTMIVVNQRVPLQHGRGVVLVDDQDAVDDFAAEGADEAFGDRIWPEALAPACG